MMNFRTVTAALITLLGDAAAARFTVVGHPRQVTDASEIKSAKRRVTVFYGGGDFPKSAGRQTGAVQHMLSYNVDLQVSEAAQANLSVLTAENSTAQQIAAALAAMQDASYLADQSFDELAEIVFQILMDGRNFDLGLPKGTISSRWTGSIRKDDVQPLGSLVVLTGRLTYTCQTSEEVTGDTGTLATGGIETIIDIDGDDVERTGVLSGEPEEVTLGGETVTMQGEDASW